MGGSVPLSVRNS